MFKVKKVLNSSVVLAEDDDDKETVVLGKGIGYGAHKGQVLKDNDISQLFVHIESEQQNQIFELLGSISPEVVDVTTESLEIISHSLNQNVSNRLLFSLMDHIDFALQRLRAGMNIQNKLYWEVKTYYPDEFEVSKQVLDHINEKLQVTLPKEEVANIAFHIINAENDSSEDYDSIKVTELVDDMVNIVRYQAKKEIVQDTISYRRLITHIKFFVDRLFTDKQLDGDDDFLFEDIQSRYPEAVGIANILCAFIQRKYALNVSNEEFVFLVVHIERNIH